MAWRAQQVEGSGLQWRMMTTVDVNRPSGNLTGARLMDRHLGCTGTAGGKGKAVKRLVVSAHRWISDLAMGNQHRFGCKTM